MGQILTIILIIGFWIISFVEPSGWALMLHLPEKVNILIVTLAAIFYLFSPHNRQKIPKSIGWLIGLTFIGIPLIAAGSWEGASYLVSFLTVYIISQGKITHKVIKYTGLAIAAMGLVVLDIYVNGTILKGWNDNAISMVGLFSFLYFSIYLISTRGKRKFWILNIITYIYLTLLLATDCRSGMLFSIVAVVGIVFSDKVKSWVTHRGAIMLILNIPLIIAILTIWISNTDLFYSLNKWSILNYDKTIFSGREILWNQAFTQLEQSYFIGTGKFMMNYHNSGLAALSVFGVLGYIFWIKYFNINLSRLKRYIGDDIVFASLYAFCLLFLQQSVDLGFISPCPDLLPYMILGVGLGRIRYLSAHHSSPA